MQDPVLAGVHLIAEPWDTGQGGYDVGNFPVDWSEWNGRYRDTVRRYWKGNPQELSDLATRIAGSSDLYAADGRRPSASVNFIAAHDGFMVADLVTMTASTTRPTCRTTPTARTATTAGTAAPKARPPIWRSSPCAPGRSAT